MKNDVTGVAYLQQKVVDGGYCIGCGACASDKEPAAVMELDELGQYKPVFKESGNPHSGLEKICPHSGVSSDEDELAGMLFGGDSDIRRADVVGYYRGLYVGHVAENEFRERATSGGMTSWLICELLTQKKIDHVIHVEGCRPSDSGGVHSRYCISSSRDEVLSRTKSRYYPIELSEVIRHVRDVPGRYAFVGLPCFVKAVRLMSQTDPLLSERIRYSFSIFCGHMKSAHFASMFAWQCGIHPDDLEYIDFRVKHDTPPANSYAIRVIGRGADGTVIDQTRVNRSFYASSWGHGFFKNHACDFCDDLLGETADATFGDAWFSPYVDDVKGTNLAIIRRKEIQEMVHQAIEEGRLSLKPLTPEDLLVSEAAGIRHRRAGTAYRLLLKKNAGEWAPRKRTEPGAKGIGRRYRKIFKLRYEIAKQSHVAFQKALKGGTFEIFKQEMAPIVKQYNNLYSGNFMVRNWKRIRWHIDRHILRPLKLLK